MAPRFAHIINPYHAQQGTDAHRIQQVTLHSIANAVAYRPNVAVQLLTAQFEEDRPMVPAHFTATEDLQRSVLDLQQFSHKRKYALIADVLMRAYAASEAEFIIYTNMDIILQPYFYEAVDRHVRSGADVLIINRRRIADSGQTADDLALILAQVGRSHPGFDCFVMHRSLVPKLLLDGICVGVPFVEAALLYNLLAVAADARILTDAHLTVHLGMEVMPPRDGEYHRYNQRCFDAILPKLKPLLVGATLPYSEMPLLQRTWKRALNPAVFSALHFELEGKTLMQRARAYWNELRFRWLERE